MGEFRGLVCDGCGTTLTFPVRRAEGIVPTKAIIEQQARNRDWQAPCKDGRHLCPGCRRPEGIAPARRMRARNTARRAAERRARGG